MTNAKPEYCIFCNSTHVITMPNDRAYEGGIPSVGTTDQDAFYCHCENCGADGPIKDNYNCAISAWNTRVQRPLNHEGALNGP
jgi:Restriction alleviation protein Lar